MGGIATPVRTVDRIEPGTEEARRLARSAYEQLVTLLAELEREEWDRATVCEDWDVADMVRHLVGAAKAYASPVELTRQMAHGFRRRKEHGGSYLDALNHLQVTEHRHLAAGEQLITELRRLGPKAVRGRMRIPSLLGRIPLPVPTTGNMPSGAPTRLTVGELNAVTATRDVWLHRTDIARATGRDLVLEPSTDGRTVEDVVIEWAHRHGRPFDLTLTGPAGGHWIQGETGPELTFDPVDFCWMLSGRLPVEADRPGRDLFDTTLLF